MNVDHVQAKPAEQPRETHLPAPPSPIEQLDQNGVQMVTTTIPAETPQERTSRLKREEWEAIINHILKAVAVFVYVSMIGLCAYYLNDPKLADFAQRTIEPMVAALAAFAVGRSIK